MNRTPKISVLIPTYNSATLIEEAIDSVFSQTFTDFELIVLDNQSTDNTDEVILKYKSDPRFSYHKNEKNLGAVGNFNRIIDFANGEYIKFLCADDKFHPQLLEKFVAILDQYPYVSLVSSYFEEFDLGTKIWETPLKLLQPGELIIKEVLKGYNFLGSPTGIMFRKSNLHLGKFKPEFTWVTDWDLWLRHLSIGDCYIIPEVLTYTRLHDLQVTASARKDYRTYYEKYDLYKIIKAKNEYQINLAEVNIDGLIKKRATELAMVLPHTILNFKKKEARKVFKKAMKAAYDEGVIMTSFRLLTKRFLNRLSSYK